MLLAAELQASDAPSRVQYAVAGVHRTSAAARAIANAIISLQNADFGLVQLYNADSQGLEIAVQRGFQQQVVDYFGNVHDNGAACGQAMRRRERITIEKMFRPIRIFNRTGRSRHPPAFAACSPRLC